ncbi:hypothetical protein [Hyphomicrobium sp. ghe19]|uniref:hypothetical protein n=1 Tax=Hyphomicrobium sp. ghe19 TaxID=2682968 RepID=UPI001366A4A3|nr:hypothetical protein HYPP_01672 [Hyphomicrobium sp. ghe19]
MIRNFLFSMLTAALVLPAAANARILCDGAFQVLPTGQLSTPYCQDEDLARRAQSQGVKVSGDAVRRHPSLKASLCAGSQESAACASSSND